jgi:hypothetical protein
MSVVWEERMRTINKISVEPHIGSRLFWEKNKLPPPNWAAQGKALLSFEYGMSLIYRLIYEALGCQLMGSGKQLNPEGPVLINGWHY